MKNIVHKYIKMIKKIEIENYYYNNEDVIEQEYEEYCYDIYGRYYSDNLDMFWDFVEKRMYNENN